MIYYTIRASLAARYVQKLVVSTDDEEIALFASRFGAEVIMRPEELGEDTVTLDPVIEQAVNEAERRFHERYDIILTVQPTSPLIRPSDLEEAMEKFNDPKVDTVLSVADNRHLSWTVVDGKPMPTYQKRVNRQQLPPNYKETGAIIACRRAQLEKGSRIGKNIALYEMAHSRSFDIDNISDLYLCESILNHKRIVFTVVGNKKTGLGHAYRAVMLAHELVKYDVIFVCEEQEDLAIEYIASQNYHVCTSQNGSLLAKVLSLKPDMVINDILDTEISYIVSLKDNNIIVVNFEDLGDGHKKADLVINALYPHQVPSKRVLVGPRYFCLRDEFLHAPPLQSPNNNIERVLITYGGVDEGNLTVRILRLIASECMAQNIEIDIVVGPGYIHASNLQSVIHEIGYDKIHYVFGTVRISDFMAKANLAFTSGGRTVYELAAFGIPTIVICQNQREATHTFASSENGVFNLGNCKEVTDEEIVQAFNRIATDGELRITMRERIGSMNLTLGKKRVIRKICMLFEREKQ